ncbi:hypothetical protein [Lutibacter sp.]|uniref:hypothetical protein n=1 Tax=Lutibacter sp. TaxID=1925666 RepID=UPI001A2E1EA6|nr:hypothetical protein [Lutibacter sp.]MBI9042236.1 hypothetical protein [Lutibacter sp.]
MKYFFSKNWIVLLIIISLISVKFYYLYLSKLNNSYKDVAAYNNGDASHYLRIGKNIADYNVYSDTNSSEASELATWRPPFWPFILSFFFRFTTDVLNLIFLKSILEIGLIIFALLKYKNKSKLKLIYLLPFFLVFIEPQYLKYSVTFLSESLTAILILLLTIYFISLNKTKNYHIAIPILSAFIILCHPVSIFFVVTLFIIYLIFNLRSNFSIVLVHGILFSLLLLAWPYRNQATFNKGLYLTASQGATLSKGWNEKVAKEFTNTDGDLANETLNLKYVDDNLLKDIDKSILTRSKLYLEGTKNFINSISFKEKFNIVIKKLRSNFNPFPEKPKPGFLETLSILFRILYVFTFLQLIFRVIKKNKIDYNSKDDKIYLVILAVFVGQIIMSAYIYTGLRFNSIYSLTMLFCFIQLNYNFLFKLMSKILPSKHENEI